MLFNSLEFILFLLVVLALYRLLNHRWQNRMLLSASYYFYACWDWRFLGLIAISTLTDYLVGQRIHNSENLKRKKFLLAISVSVNLGILGFFKYFDFFADSLQAVASSIGWQFDSPTLGILLPVGISFYTFQTMSYSIDIFRGRVKPIGRLEDYALYVAFFPQLVAGPIERASRLLPQIASPRKVTRQQVHEGLWLIYWGLFKKIAIADNLAKIADQGFTASAGASGLHSLLAVYAFAFQIFCDFSSYSDIARGTAKLLGIELMVNFRFPYFVTNPQSLWRHWHISLSSWLRDYLYISLGGNRHGRLKQYRNLMVTMILGGLWHGAAWTFVIWGFYHGLLLAAYHGLQPVIKKISGSLSDRLRAISRALAALGMFHLTCLGWLVFRSQSLEQAGQMLGNLAFHFADHASGLGYTAAKLLLLVSPVLIVQIAQKIKKDESFILSLEPVKRWSIVLVLFYFLAIGGEFGGRQFYYFQF